MVSMAADPTNDAMKVTAAFKHLGIDVVADGDLVIPIALGDPITVRRGESGAWHETHESTKAGYEIIVADRLTEGQRHHLRSMKTGWLDLRGHLAFRSPTLVIDAEVPAQVTPGSDRSVSVLAGEVVSGVTMLALAAWPSALPGVRATGRLIGSSPGGASLAIKRLIAAGLLTTDHRATAALFWSAASEWRPSWTELPLTALPDNAPVVAVGAHAASLYGAPVAVLTGSKPEFLVGSQTVLDYAAFVVDGERTDGDTVTGRFAVAPAKVVFDQIDQDALRVDDTPVASAAIVALSLAVDPGRGAETVRLWQGNHVW